MSNLAKQKLKVPAGIFIKKTKDSLVVEGPLGKKQIPVLTEIILINNCIEITDKLLPQFKKEKFKLNPKALQGTTAALIKQAFVGLRSGFRAQLKLVGVGYKVSLGKTENVSFLTLKLGYSHTVSIRVPCALKITCFKNNSISLFGPDKQQVNNFAAVIRAYKKPEPYKGKGILYQGEKIILKEGKRS